VLRLLPGEETIFELRVVNHGNPANIFVDASPPLIKAMRLKRANHHVEMEEIIPVLARMPDNLDRLDGEILVTSDKGTNRIPISLISEGSGEDGEDPQEYSNNKSRIFDPEKNDGEEDDDYVEEHAENDELDSEEIQDATDAYFDNEKDVENYRSASRPKSPSAHTTASGYSQPQHYDPFNNYEKTEPWEEMKSPKSQKYSLDHGEEIETPYYSKDGDFRSIQDPSYQSSEDVEKEGDDEEGLQWLDRLGNLIQIAPIVMFILIIAVLILTFYTATIPEFLGALASSILIVTLIIYGAATLLKA
jgi:hypothetical protein